MYNIYSFDNNYHPNIKSINCFPLEKPKFMNPFFIQNNTNYPTSDDDDNNYNKR